MKELFRQVWCRLNGHLESKLLKWMFWVWAGLLIGVAWALFSAMDQG